MRGIHLAHLEGLRPVVVLTRDVAVPYMSKVTVAPVTSRVRGLLTEVAVGPANGIDGFSVVSCDNIQTIRIEQLERRIGELLPQQEQALAAAISAAFDLAE